MNNNNNILFYLTTCTTCQGFIKLCQENKILYKFKLVSIDDNIKYFISKGIEIVPTIVISGYQKPIVGKDCFNWLNSVVQMNNTPAAPILRYGSEKDIQNINKPKEDIFSVKTPQPPPMINKIQEQKPKEFLGYRKEEMNSISDSYAYKDIDNAFPMNYQTNNSAFEIYTGQEGKKITKTEQEKLIRDFRNERTNDQNEFIKITEENIKKII